MAETARELVLAVVGGDLHRFGEIVRRYDEAIRATIAREILDSDTREELVQETFYHAFKGLHGLDDPSKLGAWLQRIAARRMAQHRRTSHRREARELQAAKRNEQSEDRPTWIWEEAARLPRPLADILFLRYRLDLKYNEIADRLQVPPSTVRGRLHEARKRLRAELEKRGLQP